jgi:hypothetical protein
MAEKTPSSYAATVAAIETAYEFMLAYAAQGRDVDTGPAAPPIRAQLEQLRDGMTRLAAEARAEASGLAAGSDALESFLGVLGADVAAACAKVDLVLAATTIGSQLVDNLNASIHVRAVLTDLFVLDEFIKSLRRAT